MPGLKVRLAPPFPRAIEALHRALVLYQAGGKRAAVVDPIRTFVTAGRAAGVLLPALLGTVRTLWTRACPAALGVIAGEEDAADPRLDGIVRLLLAEYDRAGV